MKTDPLFYELFQAAPQTFFELAQITPQCRYRFESVTVKASEKRIDGVLEPEDFGQPYYFLEVQAFPDPVIYWRLMREVSTFFEQRPNLSDANWQAVVLWVNKADDPGAGTLVQLTRKPMPRIVSLDLLRMLKRLPDNSLALNVLRPLLAKNEREVRRNVVQWIEHIRAVTVSDANLEERLINVLSQMIEQKFRELNYKELSQMLRLTPFRETTSYQEAVKEDTVEYLLGMIQVKFDLSGETLDAIATDLHKLELTTLKTLFRQLLRLDSFEQLEAWIEDHQPWRIGT